VANNALYIHAINVEGKIPFEQEILSPTQRLNEYIMTSLRTMWGCDLLQVEREWGSEHSTQLSEGADPFIKAGKMLKQGQKLVLTNEGRLFADGIASELFFTDPVST
jgi:oxygen-independent coproporphyrinogen-3 oxidase